MTPLAIYEGVSLIFIAACMLIACGARAASRRVQADLAALAREQANQANPTHRCSTR
jgi:hypothetical protein